MKVSSIIFITLVIFFNYCFSQTPILNSKINVTNQVIYLDFDGQAVSGTPWNIDFNTSTITALPSTMNSANKIKIWKRVSEDFRPFDVNVTTELTKFNAAITNKRARVIITPSSAWYGTAGGVAYGNSFAWGGNPDTPVWVFENLLGYMEKSIGEACSHETGHSLGLLHQSAYNSNCVKTEYNPGVGSGVTSWAPIMGNSYTKNVTVWHNGKNTTACTTTQNDHGSGVPGITGPAFLSFSPDDVGNSYAAAKTLVLGSPTVLDSGIISQPTDIDVFKFNLTQNSYVGFQVKPWAFDTVNYDGANLDIRFSFYDSGGSLLAIDTTLTKLNTKAGLYLTPGSYYFIIDGGGSSNYKDYGSLGKYFIKITSSNVSSITSAFITPSVICSGQSFVFSDISTGSPNVWSWIMPGASPPTSSVKNPTVTYAFSGVYNVTLSASNGTLSNSAVTQTISVNVTPTIALNSSSPTICSGKSVTLTASGTTSYSWNTGAITNTINASPLSTTIYTVTGTISSCNSIKTNTVVVLVSPTVAFSNSVQTICEGSSVNISSSGAFTYSWNTGATTSVISVNPPATTIYTVTGFNGFCYDSKTAIINVNALPQITVSSNSLSICHGDTITLSGSGANTYTWQPMNINGSIIKNIPSATQIYTCSGIDANNCVGTATIILNVATCVGELENGTESVVFNIYSNPTSESIVVNYPCNISSEVSLEIIDINGKIINKKTQVFNKSNANLEVNISTVAKGIYFVRVTTDNQQIITKKIAVMN